MDNLHIDVFQKRGKWLIKLNGEVYLGPYSCDSATTIAVALADVAWQLGRPAWVVLVDHKGARRVIWNHPQQRHECYA
jgi:hypothetical protein